MGKLIKRRSREEVQNTRREQKLAILKAAAHSFQHIPYADVDLNAIGRRAGLGKGIIALYFDTREVLFLLVLKEMLTPWFGAVIRELSATDDPLTPSEGARLIARMLLDRDDLTRMLQQLPCALEQNVEVLPAMNFMTWLREKADQVGQALERRCPEFSTGSGVHLLLRLQILVAGAPRMTHISGMFAAVIRDVAPGISDETRRHELEQLAEGALVGLTKN